MQPAGRATGKGDCSLVSASPRASAWRSSSYPAMCTGSIRRASSQLSVDGASLPGVPNGLAFSPDYTKLYIVCAGGLFVGEVAEARVTGVKQLARVVIDGVTCGMDGVRVDVHGNLWCSSNAGAAGYSGVTVLNAERYADRPYPLARGLRQSCVRGAQAQPAVHDRKPVALFRVRQHAGRGAGLIQRLAVCAGRSDGNPARSARRRSTMKAPSTATPAVRLPSHCVSSPSK